MRQPRSASSPGWRSAAARSALRSTAAQAGDTVRVAAGTYIEYVVVTKSVTLEGGWNADLTARDPATFVTTIRPPDATTSVVSIEGTFGQSAQLTPAIDGFTITGGGGGNHGGGMRIHDSNAIVRNNTISGNHGYLFGGGIWVQRGAPRIEGNLIADNVVTTASGGGGGVYLEGTQATLVGNVIRNNMITEAVGSGGGVNVAGGGPVTLDGNTISSNVAATIEGTTKDYSYGGGVAVSDATVTLSNNVIQGNAANGVVASGFGGGIGFGGGVYILNSTDFTLTGNLIGDTATSSMLGNTASWAYYKYPMGGGVLIESSTGSLDANVIAGNHANGNILFGNGGGLAVTVTERCEGGANPGEVCTAGFGVCMGGGTCKTGEPSAVRIHGGTIMNNIVARNCEGYGGGLYAKGSQITIDATVVENNCAANTPAYGLGGGLAFFKSPYTVTNAVITRNRSFPNDTSVGGLFADADSPGRLVNDTFTSNKAQAIRTIAPLTVTNSIIANATTGICAYDPAATAADKCSNTAITITATYNDFFGDTRPVAGLTLNSPNFLIDPQLDASNHLGASSPLIDAGTRVDVPAHDIDGDPRFAAGSSGLFKIDIGADEAPGPAQDVVDLDAEPADLTVIGPGNPPENPNSNSNNEAIGYSVLAHDVSGDGRADLVIAAEDWSEDFDTVPSTGRLFGLLNFGTSAVGTLDLLDEPSSFTIVSKYIRQHIGSALAAGDLDGDGIPDLVAGSFENDSVPNDFVYPTVFVLRGGAGLSGSRVLDDTHPADFVLRAPAQDFLAFAAKNALTTGDVTGDGVTDLVVADALANDGAVTATGAVFVVFGTHGLSGSRDLATTPADFTLYGPAANAKLGAVALGHVDADGTLDLVARTDTTAYVLLGRRSSGAIHLKTTPASIVITGLAAGGVIVTDITGDGHDDIILGSGNDLYVVLGPLAAGASVAVATGASVVLTGASATALAVGDVVGDARPDLIVGSYSLRRALVIAGGLGARGSVGATDVASTIVQGATLKFLGFDVAAGDLDADGRADLVVSAKGVDIDTHPDRFKDAGTVYVSVQHAAADDDYHHRIDHEHLLVHDHDDEAEHADDHHDAPFGRHHVDYPTVDEHHDAPSGQHHVDHHALDEHDDGRADQHHDDQRAVRLGRIRRRAVRARPTRRRGSVRADPPGRDRPATDRGPRRSHAHPPPACGVGGGWEREAQADRPPAREERLQADVHPHEEGGASGALEGEEALEHLGGMPGRDRPAGRFRTAAHRWPPDVTAGDSGARGSGSDQNLNSSVGTARTFSHSALKS